MALEYGVSKFHLAILDFAMPVLNGFQLFLRLRAARASFPIVPLSGMSRDLPNDMRIVFSSCVDKGEPIHLLLKTVRTYLTPIPTHRMQEEFDALQAQRRSLWSLVSELLLANEQLPSKLREDAVHLGCDVIDCPESELIVRREPK
jgi:DNA-binding response OmpR family regulator